MSRVKSNMTVLPMPPMQSIQTMRNSRNRQRLLMQQVLSSFPVPQSTRPCLDMSKICPKSVQIVFKSFQSIGSWLNDGQLPEKPMGLWGSHGITPLSTKRFGELTTDITDITDIQ